jgi:hypothetical protein
MEEEAAHYRSLLLFFLFYAPQKCAILQPLQRISAVSPAAALSQQRQRVLGGMAGSLGGTHLPMPIPIPKALGMNICLWVNVGKRSAANRPLSPNILYGSRSGCGL